eukprot:1307264-Lingulodinium_polyedra.AAC.1
MIGPSRWGGRPIEPPELSRPYVVRVINWTWLDHDQKGGPQGCVTRGWLHGRLHLHRTGRRSRTHGEELQGG